MSIPSSGLGHDGPLTAIGGAVALDDDATLAALGGPLAVPPKVACRMLGVGLTRLYEIIDAGELETYLEGRARRITTRSIYARFKRQLERAKAA